jgi:regulator of cell morphogenesis and NO signaling
MTDNTIDPDRTLASLVSENPSFARVFESLDLDFCCGGDQTLRAACEESGLDLDAIRAELISTRREREEGGKEWDSMSAVIDHVVETHHEYLEEELPALGQLVAKVRDVHGENHPELASIEAEFEELAAEMREHTTEEETDVFPIVEKLDAGESLTAEERGVLETALDDLEADHEDTAEHLERIAELSDGYVVPDDACPSYRSMLERLDALERDTHMHVHKENNVLFPEVESRLADVA